MKPAASPVALIGDIVHSRDAPDRQGLHNTLEAVLAEVNGVTAPDDPLLITVGGGDEFQALFLTLGQALDATFRIRLALSTRATADVRFGAGRGEVRVLDARRGIHDGPAYWAARASIERTKERAAQARTRTARTAYTAPDDDPAHVGAVQAALDCLDFMVGSLPKPSRAILEGLMNGQTQRELAQQQGVSPSAVSQRMRRGGIGVSLETMTRLAALP